jgi:hypothetical protein
MSDFKAVGKGVVDLAKVKSLSNVAQGFKAEVNLVNVQDAEGQVGQMPVLTLAFITESGEERKGVAVPPGLLMGLISALSQFGAEISGVQRQQVNG